jgi:hypothetical protein
MFHIGDGLSKNSGLVKLSLGDNNLSDPLCIKYITDGLLSSKVSPQLTHLELQKCSIGSKSVKFLA